MSRAVHDPDGDERERRAALIDQLQVLGEVSSTETALFHQTAAARYGLGITDMKTISALVLEGPMTAGQLAKRLSLTSGAITNVIDRLERQGFARRASDPDDRRKVIVVVNREQLAAGDAAYRSMGAVFAQLFATYSTEQLAFLVRFYEAAVELTKQEIAKLASLPGG